MIIIGLFGKTGSGKTEILAELKKNYVVVDIEECANTKGSVLGDLYELRPKTQAEFDECLKKQHDVAEKAGYCIVEFEGRKIGGNEKVDIPTPYSNLDQYTYNILINCPYEAQIERLLNWYIPKNEQEKEILLEKFNYLKNAFSKPHKIEILDKIIKLIEKDSYYEAAILIEEGLYSEHYLRHIQKVKHDFVIENRDILESCKVIAEFIDEILKKHGIKR